jgi:hypothetical protein
MGTMTLIFSMATPEWVIQVSDRRLFNPDDPAGPYIDDATKTVLYCNQISYAYSGRAVIQQETADDYLVRIISEQKNPSRSPKRLAEYMAECLTRKFRAIRDSPANKRLTIVGTGWAVPAPIAARLNLQNIPIIQQISNHYRQEEDSKKGKYLPEAMEEFEVGENPLLRPSPFGTPKWGWTTHGQSLEPSERSDIDFKIDRIMKRMRKKKKGISWLGFATIFIKAIHAVSDRMAEGGYRNVGKNFVVTVIPRVTAGTRAHSIATMDGPANEGEKQEQLLGNTVKPFGPAIVCPFYKTRTTSRRGRT